MRAKTLATLFLALISCIPAAFAAGEAGIATSHPLATAAGSRALSQGGSAADAAVAAAFTLAVIEPSHSGLGGGGVLLYYDKAQNRLSFVDYLESLPLGAMEGVVAAIFPGADKPADNATASEIAVPGFVAGMDKIHRRFGKLPWSELFTEAIDAARDGFVPGEGFARARELMPEGYREKAGLKLFFLDPAANKKVPLKQENLAATLDKIRSNGGRAFYEGSFALAVVDEMTKLGAAVAASDFAYYEVRVGEPSVFYFKDVKVAIPGPPSYAPELLQKLLLGARVAGLGGDGEGLPAFLEAQIAKFVGEKPFLKNWPPLKPGYASAVAVVDAQGNMAAMLNTLHGLFGSGEVLSASGIVLNCAGKRGNLVAATGANDVNVDWALKRRPVNFLLPALFFRAFEENAAVAVTGGLAAPEGLFQIMLKTFVAGEAWEKSLKAPKFYSLPQDKTNLHESGFPAKLLKTGLKQESKPSPYPVGGVQAVVTGKSRVKALSDARAFGRGETVRVK